MIVTVVICHHQNPDPIEQATRFVSPHRILVIDRSPEVTSKGWEHVIHNDDGTGFLAGRMRNIGTAKAFAEYPNLEGIIYFDCDRIPNKIPSVWQHDTVLYMGQNDTRFSIAGDVTSECDSLNSPFYSGAFYLSRKALDAVNHVPFDSDYDGMWGWEDADLGDRLTHTGIKIFLDKDLTIDSAFIEPDWIHHSHPSDVRFRNWHIRINKRRKHMQEQKQENATAQNPAMQPQERRVPVEAVVNDAAKSLESLQTSFNLTVQHIMGIVNNFAANLNAQARLLNDATQKRIEVEKENAVLKARITALEGAGVVSTKKSKKQ